MSCSRTQHSDSIYGKSRTINPSIPSLTLFLLTHWAPQILASNKHTLLYFVYYKMCRLWREFTDGLASFLISIWMLCLCGKSRITMKSIPNIYQTEYGAPMWENLLVTRSYANQPAQLQRLARILKFCILQV